MASSSTGEVVRSPTWGLKRFPRIPSRMGRSKKSLWEMSFGTPFSSTTVRS
jgi:hypothetical protein